MGLAGQAFRLLKSDWPDSQILSEELYLILLTDVDATLGPTSVATVGSTDTPTQLSPGIADALAPSLNLGALDFPIAPDNPLDQQQQSQDVPNDPGSSFFYQRERRTVTTEHVRTVTPGLVTVATGAGRYAVRLYPNSSQVNTFEDVTGVKQLDGTADLAVGTWALVFRHTEFELTKVEQVQTGGNQPEKVVSTSTEVRVVARHHEMAASSGGGGGVPVQIVSGTGATYLANAYARGLANTGLEVTVTVLQIDPAETIPAGTWLIAAKIGVDYFVQPGVWLNG